MSDTPQKTTTGADIIAAIKWCHSRAEERHQEMMTALAEMKAAKPAASSPAPAGGRKFGEKPPTQPIRGVVTKGGARLAEKVANINISVGNDFLKVANFGHRRDEVAALQLMDGDEVEFEAEAPAWKTYTKNDGSQGAGWESIGHGCKIIKPVQRQAPPDDYADFGAPRADYSATGHAIPGTSAADDLIPF